MSSSVYVVTARGHFCSGRTSLQVGYCLLLIDGTRDDILEVVPVCEMRILLVAGLRYRLVFAY